MIPRKGIRTLYCQHKLCSQAINKFKDSHQRGITLVELTIAVAIATIVIMIVFYAWNSLNKHMGSSKHRTQIETEANRIGDMVSSHIRRSSAVLAWDESSISLINPNGTDTFNYYYRADTLYRNGTSLPVLVNDAKISSFTINNQNANLPGNENSLLLDISLTLSSPSGDSASAHFTVQLSGPTQKGTIESENWGF